MDIKDGFRFRDFDGNGRKRSLKCSAGSTRCKVEMRQKRAVTVLG